MVEIPDFAGEAVTPLVIAADQGVRFRPEALFVDSVAPEKRFLHVSRNKGLVEIPDPGDDVLSKEGCGHLRSRTLELAERKQASQIGPSLMETLPDIGPFRHRLEELDAQ